MSHHFVYVVETRELLRCEFEAFEPLWVTALVEKFSFLKFHEVGTLETSCSLELYKVNKIIYRI